MKAIFEVFIGFMLIIYDSTKYALVASKDFLKFLVTTNRKDNKFVAIMGRNCWVLDFLLYMGVFVLVGSFSYIFAIGAVVLTWIFFGRFKYNWNRKTEGEYFSDNKLAAGFAASALVMLITTIYVNVNTPYTYEKVGTINFTEKEMLVGKTFGRMIYNVGDKEVKSRIGYCEPGTLEIFKETLEPDMFTFLKTDYIFGCSGYMEKRKVMDAI